MGHSVLTCKSGSEISCSNVHDGQLSGWPLGSAETIAKMEQEMLENWHVTGHELCERIPEPAQHGRRVLRQINRN